MAIIQKRAFDPPIGFAVQLDPDQSTKSTKLTGRNRRLPSFKLETTPGYTARRLRTEFLKAVFIFPGCTWVWSFVISGMLCAAAPGAEVRIDHIELFHTRQVTVHFNTEANRTYYLQSRDDLCPGTNAVCS